MKYTVNGAGSAVRVYKAIDRTCNSVINTAAKTASTVNKLVNNPRVTVKTTMDLGPLCERVKKYGAAGIINKKSELQHSTTYYGYIRSKAVRGLKNTGVYKAAHMMKKDIKDFSRDIKVAKGAIRRNTRITAKGVKHLKTGTCKVILKTGSKIMVRTVGKVTVRTLKLQYHITATIIKNTPKAAKYTIKGASKLTEITSDALIAGENAMLETTGYTIKTVHTSARLTKDTVKTGAKVAVKTGKVAGKGFRAARTGISYARKNGLKKAAARAGEKAVKGIASAARNGFSLVTKAVFRRLLVPVVVTVLIAAGAFVMIGGGGAVVGSIFSGVTSVVSGVKEKVASFFGGGEDEEDGPADIDMDEYLRGRIKKSRNELRDDVIKSLKKKGSYFEVRFYNKELDMDIPVDPELARSKNKVSRMIYSEEAILRIIEPVFNARVVAEYGLEVPKMKDLDDMYDDIAKDIFVIKSEEFIEYCTPDICPSCGNHHSSDGCPSVNQGSHSDTSLCHDCCRTTHMICEGHLSGYECGCEEHDHSGKDLDDAFDYFMDNDSDVDTVWYNWKLTGKTYERNGRITYYARCAKGGDGDCNGHRHSDGCRKTRYHWADGSFREERPGGGDSYIEGSPCDHTSAVDVCGGYSYCEGHKIKRIYIQPKELDEFIDDNYTKKIEKLEKEVAKKSKKLDKAKDKKKPDEEDIAEKEDELTDLEKKLDDLEQARDLTYNFLELIDDELGLGEEGEDADAKKLANMDISNLYAQKAAGQTGKPFVFEGEDPNVGFDDIGLVKYVYGQALNDVDSYKALASHGAFDFSHSYEDDREGALILYTYGVKKVNSQGVEDYSDVFDPENIYHVGISLGNGYMVHAAGAPAVGGKQGGRVRVSRVSADAVMKIGIPRQEVLG